MAKQTSQPHHSRVASIILLFILLSLGTSIGWTHEGGAGEIPPESTAEVTSDPVSEGTGEPQNTPESTISSETETPRVEPTHDSPENSPIRPQYAQTFCQMDIGDADDDNPFTYRFSIVQAENIASFEWTLGDTTVRNDATPFTHTYADVGTYNITLVCTPQTEFGSSPITLNGSVTIEPVPQATFEVLPGYTIVQNVSPAQPVVLTTVNQSTPVGLTFEWEVKRTSDDTVICDGTTETITCNITEYGEYVVSLTATIGTTSSVMVRTVAVNAPAPSATFTLSETSGFGPTLPVEITGIDQGTGPITTWTWTWNNGDLSAQTGPGPFTVNFPLGTHIITLDYSGPGGGGRVVKQLIVYEEIEPLTADFKWDVLGAAAGGGTEICFTNMSAGPYTQSEWDFDGDGTYEVTSSLSPICHVYTTEGMRQVSLRVSNTDAFSEYSDFIDVRQAPVAQFTVSPGDEITEGTLISLTGDISTGDIDNYTWEINGVENSSGPTANLTGVALPQVGANQIRLTVTGPGGSSYTEQIVFVNRLELTCDFDGSLSVLPNAGAQTYTSNIGNAGARDIDYVWRVTGSGTGLPLTVNTEDLTVDWFTVGTGNFLVTLEASWTDGDDGSNCSKSKTVNVSYPPLVCGMNSSLPGTIYPDGEDYTFSGTLSGLEDRTVTGQTMQVYKDGVLQTTDTGDSLNWTNLIDSTLSSPVQWRVRYTATASDGSECFEDLDFSTQPYPNPTCSVGGADSVRPEMPNHHGQYNYTITMNDPAGRSFINPAWSLGPNGEYVSAAVSDSITVRWLPVAAPTYSYNTYVDGTITVQNADGNTFSLDCSRLNVTATVPRLTCATPSGDTTPVFGEQESYASSVGNVQGRPLTINWTLVRQSDNEVFTGTGSNFSYLFDLDETSYLLRYTASVTGIPSDQCTSGNLPITVAPADISFDCDAFPDGFGNNFEPASATGSYPYTVDVDNGNGILLRYDYTLLRPGTNETPLAAYSSTSTNDNYVTLPAISGADLAPFGIGNYILRVDVRADDPTVTPYTCSLQRELQVGTLSVDYTYVDGGGDPVSNTAVEVGQQICFTNTSTTSHEGISGLDYTWTISGDAADNSLGLNNHSGQDLPNCVSYSQQGTYTVRLDGENRNQGDSSFERSGSRTVTFNVWNTQSITIIRSNQVIAPTNMTFSATGVNITSGYTWRFYLQDGGGNWNQVGGTSSGASINRSLSSPGMYRAVVTGSGPLGQTSASTEFELISTSDLRASFRASQYAGVAELYVCFTDTSIGDNILTWSWDFDNGETLNYTAGSIPSEICTTYPDAASTYRPTLIVTNSMFTRTAQNTIRTYTALESSASFTITPQGSGGYCFSATGPAGMIVTGWDFDDGSTGSGQSNICHNYSAAGVYRVQMYIESPEGEGGIVERVVTVDPGASGTPNLSASGVCSDARVATFTVTNSGDAMTTADQIVIRNQAGDVIFTGPVQLGAGASQDFSLSDQSGAVTMALTDYASVTANTTCYYPPEISIDSTCSNNLPVFTISNTRSADGPMTAPQSYEIRDSENTLIQSGTFQLGLGTASQQISVPVGNNPYETYSFISDGAVGTFDVDGTCATQPVLDVVSLCALDEPAFVISNNGGDMVLSQSFTITQNSTTILSGSMQIGGGEQVVLTLPAGTDPYETITLTSSGFAGAINTDYDCDSPNLVVTSNCASPVVLTVTNNGGDMVAAQGYTVTSGSSVVTSGDLALAAGESVNITLSGADPYAAYDFSTTGFAGNVSYTHDCQDPDLDASSLCASPAAITITNNGGDMLESQNYAITSGGDVVASGTLSLASADSLTITLDGLDPYAAYDFSTTGFAGDLNYTHDCDDPAFVMDSVCASPVAITITNHGGDMLEGQDYAVTSNGQVLDAGTLNLANGAAMTVTLENVDPYNAYQFVTSGFAGDVDYTHDCPRPVLMATSTCDYPVSVRVENRGGQMLEPEGFTITAPNGEVVLAGSLLLDVGESYSANLENRNPYMRYEFAADGYSMSVDTMSTCGQPVLVAEGVCEPSPAFVLTNTGSPLLTGHTVNLIADNGDLLSSTAILLDTGGSELVALPEGIDYNGPITLVTGDFGVTVDAEALICEQPTRGQTVTFRPGTQPDGFAGLTLDDLPVWSDVTTCGFSCPPFQLYHTDEVGGWEIFRLDGADALSRTTVRENLSLGLDRNAKNMAPSLSPDNRWVIFQSDRDGNWELYVAPTSGGDPDAVRRVTYNEIAIDSDPMWGPNNFVVFETTRHGGWDLYMIDMSTGQEYRLTNDEGNDINPFWSPDGSSIVFQSDRPDENGQQQWEIYELNLMTGTISRLTDGSSIAVDPQYSHGGAQIVYRSYESEGAASTLVVMDADGSNRRAISDPAGDATNPAWSPSDRYIAYQSDLNGGLDVYVYEVSTGKTRQVTMDEAANYAPTWMCDDVHIMFTSDVEDAPNIFIVRATPVDDPPVFAAADADQMTFEQYNDVYPMSMPAEENASREGQTVRGEFGEQTSFLNPDVAVTLPDLSLDGLVRDPNISIDVCPMPDSES